MSGRRRGDGDAALCKGGLVGVAHNGLQWTRASHPQARSDADRFSLHVSTAKTDVASVASTSVFNPFQGAAETAVDTRVETVGHELIDSIEKAVETGMVADGHMPWFLGGALAWSAVSKMRSSASRAVRMAGWGVLGTGAATVAGVDVAQIGSVLDGGAQALSAPLHLVDDARRVVNASNEAARRREIEMDALEPVSAKERGAPRPLGANRR
jgi:hypothetical protein